MKPSILILVALQHEADALSKRLKGFRIEVIGLRAKYPWDARGAEVIFLTGLAGALDPALRCGDVILDETSDAAFVGKIDESARIGKIVTADAMVASAQAKLEMYQQTAALAVEMEADRVRAATAKLGLRFVHVRAISDEANQSLDPAVLSFIDDRGKPRLGAIARTLMKRPSLVSHVAQLRSQSTLALDRLADALSRLLN